MSQQKAFPIQPQPWPGSLATLRSRSGLNLADFTVNFGSSFSKVCPLDRTASKLASNSSPPRLSAMDEMVAPTRAAESILPSAVMAALTKMRVRFMDNILTALAEKWRIRFVRAVLWYTLCPWE